VYPLLGDSSTLLVLADPKARVREIFAAPELVGRCSERGLRSGGSLSEENCGTNAIGLVAKHWELSVVSGAQHHCKMFHDWHCVAAPILDAGGKVHGIVNVARSVSQHLRDEPALVRLLAGTLSSSLDPSLASGDARTLGISPMQGTIVAALRCGLTCKQIASQLNVSARTVESHLERLRRRFSASTTVQLMVILAEGPRVGGALHLRQNQASLKEKSRGRPRSEAHVVGHAPDQLLLTTAFWPRVAPALRWNRASLPSSAKPSLGLLMLVKVYGAFDAALGSRNISVRWQEYAGSMQIVDALGRGELDIGVIGDGPAVYAHLRSSGRKSSRSCRVVSGRARCRRC
jgi:DNA-binding CsgD family transcriptional regulator